MKTIGLVIHPANPKAKETADRIREDGAHRGLDVVTVDGSTVEPDAILALGGDGTLLRAAQVAWRLDVPVLGANLGNLGFLSTVDPGMVDDMVQALITDIYRVEHRMVLQATAYQGDREVSNFMALNEVVVERDTVARVVTVRVSVGDEAVARYTADGFIVATPTGSTAYSLSAGGPVVAPDVSAIVLTSVCAHTPLWRSIVVAASRTVTLEMAQDSVALSADGQHLGDLQPGGVIEIQAHPRPLKLLAAYKSHFYDKLRARFHVEPNE